MNFNTKYTRTFVAVGVFLFATVGVASITKTLKNNSPPIAPKEKTIHTTEDVSFKETTVKPSLPKGEGIKPGLADLQQIDKKVTRVKVSKNRVIYMNEQVDFGSARRVTESLKQMDIEDSKTPIYLLLDSPGGSVIDGASVISQIEASHAPVYTVCTRLCASMAAMIHSYGHKRYSLDRAILMYHPASGGVQGQIPNALSLMGTIQRFVDKMNANVVGRSKLSKETFERLVAYELWIDAEDSLANGLIDGIINLSVPSVPDGGPTQFQEQSFKPGPLDPKRNNREFTANTFNVEMMGPVWIK